MTVGICSASGASNCYQKCLAMDLRRLGAYSVLLSIYQRQDITANLRIIALEPTESFTLRNRAVVFQKQNVIKKPKFSEK